MSWLRHQPQDSGDHVLTGAVPGPLGRPGGADAGRAAAHFIRLRFSHEVSRGGGPSGKRPRPQTPHRRHLPSSQLRDQGGTTARVTHVSTPEGPTAHRAPGSQPTGTRAASYSGPSPEVHSSGSVCRGEPFDGVPELAFALRVVGLLGRPGRTGAVYAGPGRAGLTATAGRRAPGLRREELAQLAGLSGDRVLRLGAVMREEPLGPGRRRPAPSPSALPDRARPACTAATGSFRRRTGRSAPMCPRASSGSPRAWATSRSGLFTADWTLVWWNTTWGRPARRPHCPPESRTEPRARPFRQRRRSRLNASRPVQSERGQDTFEASIVADLKDVAPPAAPRRRPARSSRARPPGRIRCLHSSLDHADSRRPAHHRPQDDRASRDR